MAAKDFRPAQTFEFRGGTSFRRETICAPEEAVDDMMTDVDDVSVVDDDDDAPVENSKSPSNAPKCTRRELESTANDSLDRRTSSISIWSLQRGGTVSSARLIDFSSKMMSDDFVGTSDRLVDAGVSTIVVLHKSSRVDIASSFGLISFSPPKPSIGRLNGELLPRQVSMTLYGESMNGRA